MINHQDWIEGKLAEFYEKFSPTEGCQAEHDDGKCLHCNNKPCPHCRAWGGREGESKVNRTPEANCKQIKNFIRTALEEQKIELEREWEKQINSRPIESNAHKKAVSRLRSRFKNHFTLPNQQ